MIRRSARPRIVVVGGAGAMGRITARDLAETAAHTELVIADRNGSGAHRLARSLGKGTRGVEVDASDPESLARCVGRATVIVNACHHSFNLSVMAAAVSLGAHYCDRGGQASRDASRTFRDAHREALKRPLIYGCV